MNYYERNPAASPQVDHNIRMNNRRNLEITGVKEVDSFDNEEFLLKTEMGYLIIRGENLQMKNLDVEQGNVAIKGKIYELSYLDEEHGEKAKGFFSKLFK
ncbi:sporulation protein YabP [Aquibacillus koreensis]|uniref:Sporulation protein YabP n=1 Tax=Aquibacillus koreensis TaxID=279446 RepID=A0A9X3WPA1_9BACI|nr:sporulation protein YabP [Aquibacillus koreensis]MCT2534306.1 sporulation protein YabP [Aquibacillus koreensis]MDC3422383.1 sporulation protein YabP [Aquibacillus koreensis]